MDFYKLSKTVLFQGATPEETEQMLSCLKAGKRKYKKEEMIYRVGEVLYRHCFIRKCFNRK